MYTSATTRSQARVNLCKRREKRSPSEPTRGRETKAILHYPGGMLLPVYVHGESCDRISMLQLKSYIARMPLMLRENVSHCRSGAIPDISHRIKLSKCSGRGPTERKYDRRLIHPVLFYFWSIQNSLGPSIFSCFSTRKAIPGFGGAAHLVGSSWR